MSVIALKSIKHNGKNYNNGEIIDDITEKDELRLISKKIARYKADNDCLEGFDEILKDSEPEEITEEILTERFPEIIAEIKENAKNEGIQEEISRNEPVKYANTDYQELLNLAKTQGLTLESKNKKDIIDALESHDAEVEEIFQKLESLTLTELKALFPQD